jgi:MFS family permease
MSIRARFGVLGLPGFRRLFVGRTASLVGDGITPVALAFAVLGLTGSPTDLGLVLAAHSLVLTGLVLVGGVYADRLSPRLSMLGADLVRVASTGLIAALLLAGVAEIWELVALYAVSGAATAFFNPAADAIVPQLAPPSRLQDASALLNFSRSAGRFAGPAIAGIVMAVGSPGAALAIDAGTFAVSAACLLGLSAPGPARPEAGEERSFLADLREGWSEFAALTWLWTIVVCAAVSNAVFFPAFEVLGPTVARAELGGSSAWALIAAASGFGAILGAGLAFAVRPRRPLLAGETGVLLMAVPIALLALPAATALIAIVALLAGLAQTFAQVLWESTWVQHVPEAARSRVSGYDWFGSLALEPVGLALVGPLAAGIGVSTALWLAAATVVACQLVVLSVPSVRRLRALPGEPAAAIAMPRPVEAGD